MNNGLILAVALLCSVCPAAFAQTLASPGHALNTLQQIQGRWQSLCQRSSAGADVYQQVSLVVSFTHFTFATTQFSEPDCAVERGREKSRYRFVLRDRLFNQLQEELFAIDFQAEDVAARTVQIHPLNILRYTKGTLRLGEPAAVDVDQRLVVLDPDLIFFR